MSNYYLHRYRINGPVLAQRSGIERNASECRRNLGSVGTPKGAAAREYVWLSQRLIIRILHPPRGLSAFTGRASDILGEISRLPCNRYALPPRNPDTC